MAVAMSVALDQRIDEAAKKVEPSVVECRRDIHQHPELGNREFRTSKLVADKLERLGIEVRTPIAHTGVVGILRGGKPGRVVALRADMDALPVTEQVDLPFKSADTTPTSPSCSASPKCCRRSGASCREPLCFSFNPPKKVRRKVKRVAQR